MNPMRDLIALIESGRVHPFDRASFQVSCSARVNWRACRRQQVIDDASTVESANEQKPVDEQDGGTVSVAIANNLGHKASEPLTSTQGRSTLDT